MADLEAEHPATSLPEAVVASICAYEEEGNIGDVLDKMPATVVRRAATRPWSSSTAATDRTAEIARSYSGRRSSSSSRSTSATASRCR